MRKYVKYFIGALLLVGVLGSAAVAYAAQGVDFEAHRGGPGGPGRGPGVGGEVISVDGNTINVETPRGDEGTIVTNDETEFMVNGEAGSLADVAVGKFAMAIGEKQDDGSVLADRVMVVDELPERGSRPGDGEGMPGRPDRGPRVGGEVTAVDGNTIKVNNPRDGEGTIITDDETEFIVNGEAGSLADVAVGKFVGAHGEMQDDGSLLADQVMVHDEAPVPPDGPGRRGRGPHVGGEVISVDGNTIKVENPRDGEGTIITNDETEFIVNGEVGSLADVAVGKFVGAHGEMQDDGSILADRVMVSDELPTRPERSERPADAQGFFSSDQPAQSY